MRRILGLVLVVVMMASSAWGVTWTKDWSSTDDGSSFSGSDIQNIQNDITAQTPTLSGTNAFTGANSFSNFPTTPSAAPTTNYQVANKKYVDDYATGTVVQVVNSTDGTVATGNTALPFDNSIPQKTEGTQFLSLAITPTSATNFLVIDVVVCFACDGANNVSSAALFQDDIADALAAIGEENLEASHIQHLSFSKYMVAGTTSSTTFKVRIGSESGNTITFNGASGAVIFGGVMASSITITELAA